MQSTHPVEHLIDREFDALSPELQRAARWVRTHGAALALRSMRSAARQAGVAPATMTRLARRLGFDNFEGLRAPFVDSLSDGRVASYALRDEAPASTSTDNPYAELCALQTASINALLALNPVGAIERAADRMLAANKVHFLGQRVSHGLAFQLHYAYGLLAANGALVTNLGGTLADQISQVAPGDLLVAISQSPYTRVTVESVQQARAQGAAVLALTDSAVSPIGRSADQSLLFGTASNSLLHTTTGALALAEALLAAISKRGGAKVLEHLRSRQQQLTQSRCYWAPRATARKAVSKTVIKTPTP